MEIENHSPFDQKTLEKAGAKGQFFVFIVVAGTFDMVHSQPMQIAQEQKPFSEVDRYEGDCITAGFFEENQLVAAKKRTDLHMLGNARPKDDCLVACWLMAMRVGPVVKISMLTGPRAWNWSLLRCWHLTPPHPTPGVALHMGMTYGGAVRKPSYKGPAFDDNMIAPGWLEGDEPIILIGCHPQGRLDSQLPGIRVLALLTDANGYIQPEPMRLDTVSIDLDTDVVQLIRLTPSPRQATAPSPADDHP